MTFCEGCDQPGATAELWYSGLMGIHPVVLHPSRACAEAARVRLGGRHYLSERDASFLRNVKRLTAELRMTAIGMGK